MSDLPNAAPEEYRSRISAGKDWTEIVAWVGDLPPLPHVASQAIARIEDPDTNAGQLTDLLGQDTALAARVLKIANSAMFSCQREITTLNQAIMIIGFKSLKGIIVAATLRQLNRKFGKVEQMIWENSTCTAVVANSLAQHLKKPYMEEAFLLGLLHDLGKLVLQRQTPDDYKVVVSAVKAGAFFHDAEQEHFGFAHPLIGALVAKKWNFSPETCQVILHHHDPIETTPDNDMDEKTLIVQCADLISHHLGFGHPDGFPDVRENIDALMIMLGFAPEDVEPFLESVKEKFGEQGSAFS